jgi:cell division protein FtsI (penicillin-binding protein 3)
MQVNSFFSKKRLIFLIIIASLFIIYIISSYARLAFINSKEIAHATYIPERGSILDRNGKVLALQTNFYNLGISKSSIKNAEKLAALIAPAININPDTILKLISTSKSNFLYIKKRIEQVEYEDLKKIIEENQLSGIRFDRIPGRVYPENTLASQVIGFMGNDGKGLSGIELTQNNVLLPQSKASTPNQRGCDVYLTIDANLQYKLEKIASQSMEKTKAESIMLLACSAKTGEIISYISLPSANLNAYSNATDSEKMDRPACYAYEPGSVFKIFSVATFLTSGAIKTTDRFFCDGQYKLKTQGETIRISCLDHHGSQTAKEALEYSCNDALAQMSENIPADMFLHYIHTMGFGEKTGIELPGETRGSVKDTSHKYWSARSKPTMSIGQEISVSALQMLQAATAIANKGFPLKLTLISQIVDDKGTAVYKHEPQVLQQIFTTEAADYVLECMEATAKFGTGTKAKLGDVSIGVKTGTAQMADLETGAYSDTDFLSNCIAIFPVEKPQIILYIVITKAKGETYAGRIVAPVIAEAANTIIDHLGLSRLNSSSLAHSGKISITKAESPKIINKIPDFTGLPKRLLTPFLEREDLTVNIIGDGYVTSQNPPPGTPFTENMIIELYLE